MSFDIQPSFQSFVGSREDTEPRMPLANTSSRRTARFVLDSSLRDCGAVGAWRSVYPVRIFAGVVAAVSLMVVSALDAERASGAIVIGESIDGVGIGMTAADVDALLGAPVATSNPGRVNSPVGGPPKRDLPASPRDPSAPAFGLNVAPDPPLTFNRPAPPDRATPRPRNLAAAGEPFATAPVSYRLYPGRVSVGFTGDVVHSVTVTSPQQKTAGGIGPGSTEADFSNTVGGETCTETAAGSKVVICLHERLVAGETRTTRFVLRDDGDGLVVRTVTLQ